MSHSITISVLPSEADDWPRARMGGTDHSIPIIDFRDADYGSGLALQVGSHPDPVAYLRALSEVALDLAAQYDAQQAVAS